MENENTLKGRLILFIDYLAISKNKFEKSIEVSTGFVNNISKGIGADKLMRILKEYPTLNKDWLLTGEGPMLNTPDASGEEKKRPKAPHVIKYYPEVSGTMGGLQFLQDPSETSCDISIPGYADCKFAINAYGDSMMPLIQSGQIVLLSPWMEKFIDWGKIYLVVTRNGYRAVKRIYPGKDDKHIQLKSENPAYPPIEVEHPDVLHLYLVKGWICRNEI